MKFLARFFARPTSVYGPNIFSQRTWLTKQIDEQLRKRAYGLD